MNDRENKVSFGLKKVYKDQKQKRVHEIFSRVASRYDLMNDLMSLGIHRLWKDQAILQANPQPGDIFIDLAGGTGDLSERYLKQAEHLAVLRKKRKGFTQPVSSFTESFSSIKQTFRNSALQKSLREQSLQTKVIQEKQTKAFLVDLNFEMLLAGTRQSSLGKKTLKPVLTEEKTGSSDFEETGSRNPVSPEVIVEPSLSGSEDSDQALYGDSTQAFYRVCGDAQSLPFPTSFADCIMIAFGMRNIADISLSLQEIYRVLKPGGRFLCLEFSHPRSPLLKRIYEKYSTHIIPKLGEMIAGDRASYQYLIESIQTFPTAESFVDLIRQAGFRQGKYRFYSGGIVALHTGWA